MARPCDAACSNHTFERSFFFESGGQLMGYAAVAQLAQTILLSVVFSTNLWGISVKLFICKRIVFL